MARKYTRDARGRFASGGGGGSNRPARKAAPTRAGNRLNRDNSGRITGIGRDGATARGGRLKTASGGRRATQTASLKSPGFRSGTIAKGGRGVSGSVARSLAAAKKTAAAVKPVSRPPKTNSQILIQTRRIIEKADARKQSRAKRNMVSWNHYRNDRWIKDATAIRMAILNPPKDKKPKKPRGPSKESLAMRRWHMSRDAWNGQFGR